MYDIVFDEGFAGGLTLRCSPGRGYRLPPFAMVNLSHGERKESGRGGAGGRKPTAVVKPQSNQYSNNGNGGSSYSSVSDNLDHPRVTHLFC